MKNLSFSPPELIDERREFKATVYGLWAVFFWSTVATAFKIGLRELTPAQLIFIASLTSLVILLGALLITKQYKFLFQLSLRQYLSTAFLGFLNPFAYYIVVLKAYTLLPAQVAQPINMIWPIILVLLSVPLLKQKLSWKHLVGLLISFIGVLSISSQGELTNFRKSDPIGLLLCIASAFIWSFYWIFNVKNKLPDLIKLFWGFLFGSIFLFIYLTLTNSLSFSFSTGFWAGIYIGGFEVGFAFILWLRALSLTAHNARISNLIYIAPFISLIFIHFILKEEIYLTTVLGIIFIISGILYQQSSKKKNS